mgnify:FL=1
MYGKKLGTKQSIAFAEYNQDIENVRAIIENVNHRIKVWKVFGGEWLHDRHDLDFMSDLVMVVCALLNLEVTHGHPIRKDLHTLLPRVANQRHKEKQRKKAEGKHLTAVEEQSSGVEEMDTSEDEEEEEFHEVDRILSHRKGMAQKKPVIFYLVRFLDGVKMECTADNITSEALDEYHALHAVEAV